MYDYEDKICCKESPINFYRECCLDIIDQISWLKINLEKCNIALLSKISLSYPSVENIKAELYYSVDLVIPLRGDKIAT